MELVHPRCAGLDVSKRDAKVCVRLAGSGRAAARSTVSTWGAVTNQVLALREHLVAQQVTLVVMEATGDYWKPFYYLLEDAPFEVMLVNARHVKNLPGRKSDVSDAAWLAQLGAHGLVRGSFVPPEPIRQLRDLTRTRTAIVRERAREIQRLEKLLEDAPLTELLGPVFVSARRFARCVATVPRRDWSSGCAAGSGVVGCAPLWGGCGYGRGVRAVSAG
jgi:transposase